MTDTEQAKKQDTVPKDVAKGESSPPLKKKSKSKAIPPQGSKGHKPEGPKGPNCPFCATPLRLVDLYDEYFCDACRQYIHRHLMGIPQKTRVLLVCPTCDGDLEYVHQYEKHYCHGCKKYVSANEVKKKSIDLDLERTPAPPSPEFYLNPPPLVNSKNYLCRKCHQELQFIYQYQRWYCNNCGEYI